MWFACESVTNFPSTETFALSRIWHNWWPISHDRIQIQGTGSKCLDMKVNSEFEALILVTTSDYS